jgi:hypothetical protein
MKRKRAFFCLALFLQAAGAFAANVSMILVEAGPGASLWQKGMEWESGMMDALFNEGHIVSNAPPIQTAEETDMISPPVYQAMEDAIVGSFDYFIVVTVGVPQKSEPDKLGRITMQLFNIGLTPSKLIYSDTYTWKGGSVPRPVYYNAKLAAERLFPYIRSSL